MLKYVTKRCPNIKFTLSDKDPTEISAFRHEVPDAKHQLCCWHVIEYLKTRLAESKPPAMYDPRRAHAVCSFIDPTWAPGITEGWLEEGVHEDDAEYERPLEDSAEPLVSIYTAI
jgi:hypothetical protein